MTTENLANIVWLGKYANYQGMPVVPLESLPTEHRQSMEKTFHTNFRIIERKPTSNSTSGRFLLKSDDNNRALWFISGKK